MARNKMDSIAMGRLFMPPLVLVLVAAWAAPQANGQGYANYHGDWRGTLNFFVPPTDGAVAPVDVAAALELSIAADGGVSGRTGVAACRIAGMAGDYLNGAQASLVLDFSGCRLRRLDGNYQGLLLTSLALEHASLRLKGRAPDNVAAITISGILRR
ncbi:MAG: hypothetical protein ABIW85_10435 [Variovorax sp.]